MFTRLTAITQDGQLARRRCSRAELYSSEQGIKGDIDAVISVFSAQRLLVLGEDSIEISHDVLLNAWTKLREWLGDDRLDRALYSQVINDADEWNANQRASSYLYRSGRLAAIEAATSRWANAPARYPPLPATSAEFLRASERADRQRVRQRRGVIAFLLVLVVAFGSGAFAFFHANQATTRERDAAVSDQLVVDYEELSGTDPVLAKQEILAAWRVDPDNPVARYDMLTAARLPGKGVLTSDGASVNVVAFSPDGKLLAMGSGNGIVRLWDVATQRQIGVQLGTLNRARLIESMAFSPDGTTLAAASKDGVVRLWDVATHQLIGAPLTGDVSSAIYAMAFSPDGDLLVAGHADGTIQLWDVASGQHCP